MVSSPRLSAQTNTLTGVAAGGVGDVWAVGEADTSRGQRPLLEHYAAGCWTLVPTPTVTGYLAGVTELSPTEVWAVGTDAVDPRQLSPLVERFSGAGWTQVPTPKLGISAGLAAVAAAAPSYLWAVGHTQDSTGVARALIERWDGTSWRVVPTPNVGSSELAGVTAVGPDDAWAVGADGRGAVIEHWDGLRWQVVPNPASTLGSAVQLTGVSAVDAHDAWAVGYATEGGPSGPILEHWNGTAWREVAPAGPSGSALYGVVALSATNAWAVGYRIDNGLGLILHWNGNGWAVVTAATEGAGSNTLDAIAAAPQASRLWAVGGYLSDFASSFYHPLIETDVP